MSKRSEAIQTARALNSRGSDFNTIVSLLVERLEMQPEAARGIAAQVCGPRALAPPSSMLIRHSGIG